MALGDHIRGRNVRVSFRQNNQPVKLRAETIDIEEVAEEYVDQVNGEQRGRPGIVTDFYRVRVSAYVKDLDQLQAWLDDTANDDAAVAALKKSAAVAFDLIDGTTASYVLSECARGPWKLNVGGRKQAVKQEMTFMARYCKSTKAA